MHRKKTVVMIVDWECSAETIVQRAFLRSKRQLTKSFIVQVVDEEISRDLLDGLTVLESESSLEDVYVLRKGE